mgnify:CR=1 FL=1
MKDKSPKTKNILSAAKMLFWKHGIKRVTVEEICREAGCSKMTFYRQFENKSVVAAEVLEVISEEGQASFKALRETNLPFHQKLLEIVKLKNESSKEISREFVEDILREEDPILMAKMAELRTKGQHEFKSFLAEAQSQGHIDKDLNLDFVMTFTDRISHLAIDPMLQSHFETPEGLIEALTSIFLFGIESRKDD